MRLSNDYCKTCGRNTKQHLYVNHILHIILMVVTSGLWGFVYGWLLVSGGKPVCTVCGTKNARNGNTINDGVTQ